MPDPVFSLSDMIGDSLVDDALFAQAYEESTDRERALMKTCIARLYDWYGPRKDTVREDARQWRGGFASIRRSAPVDFALVLFDQTLASPARLLAGLVPAVACGVPNILAVRLDGGDWQRPLLTAMELAGQELVADLTGDDLGGLLRELGDAGASGAVVDLAGRPGLFTGRDRLAVHSPAFGREAAVFLDGETTFDLDALALTHPDTAFTAFGANVPLPGGFRRGGEELPDFLDAVREVAYVPDNLIGRTLGRARLAMAPGQEGCWVWPELLPDFFLFHRIAWTIGD